MTSRYLACVVLTASIGLSVANVTLRADAVTLRDAVDLPFVTYDSGSDPSFTSLCTSVRDFCQAFFDRPDAHVVSATGPLGEPVLQDGNFYSTRVDSPDGGQVGRLYIFATGSVVVQYLFFDMFDTGSSTNHNFFNDDLWPELVPIIETGGVQRASQILWSDERVDTFSFGAAGAPPGRRAPPNLPEPASLWLLGTGLALGARLRARSRGPTPT